LDVMEPLPGHYIHVPGAPILPLIRAAFSGPLFANGGYDRDSAIRLISSGGANAVSFGIPFISNPDFVERITVGASLNAADAETFYVGEHRGYIDYPTMTAGADAPDAYKPLSLAQASRH